MPEVYSTAYSLELEKEVDPTEAHRHSIEQKIHESNAFQCSKDCSFQLVLVNFGKKDFIQAPHFRSAKFDQPPHSNCSLVREQALARIGERETRFAFTRNDSKITVELDLINGLLAEITTSKKTTTKVVSPAGLSDQSSSTKKSNDLKDKIELSKKVKSLKLLIDYYERIRQGELFDMVDKNGDPLDLEQHFHNLNHDPVLQEGVVKIYVADAWVSLKGTQFDDPFYHMKLTTDCELGPVITKPTLNFNKKDSIHRGVVNKEKFLEKQANAGSKYKVYFFGSFVLNISRNNFYINLDLNSREALDFLVFYPY